jgi:hypothetical protein
VGRKGWDSLTGFGVLDVGNALAVASNRLPPHDPGEPNDNISWVNGQAFGTPAPAVWSGGGAARFDAQLDKEEDPVDVYRVIVPAHRHARISAVPRFGDVQLEVFRSGAKSINDLRRRLAYAHRRGTKRTEHATIRNSGRAAHTYYVMVSPQGRSVYQDRRYTLRVGA